MARSNRGDTGKGGGQERGGRGRRARQALTERVGGGTAELRPDPDRADGWTLLLDGAPQSYVDLADPEYLGFDYQRRIGHVIDAAAPPGRPLHVLHLGGGALTLARYVAATRPRSTQQVFERDTDLTQLVRDALPLERGWRIRVRGGDAREGLGKIPGQWADLVVADVFSGARTPAHLTSAEFLQEVGRVLAPGGLYVANIADGPGSSGAGEQAGAGGKRPPLAHLRSQVATVRASFTHAALIGEPAVLRGRRFGNGILVGADGELPYAELTRRAAADPRSARVEHGAALEQFAAGAAVVTDATALPSPAPPEGVFD